MLLLNNQPLQYDTPFTHDGVSYPANWLRLSSLEQKQAIGIVEVADVVEERYDQRFYWGVRSPKDHEQLQKHWIDKVKATASSLLSPTDWYITRLAETGKEVPAEVLVRREQIRAYSDDKEAAINSTSTTRGLEIYINSELYQEWEPVASQQPIEPKPPAAGVDTMPIDLEPPTAETMPVDLPE